MKTLQTAVIVASFATSALAQTAEVVPAAERDAAGVYQVIRGTDQQLNCAQLISEMNLLNAQIKQQATQTASAAPKAPSQAGNVAKGLMGAAAQQGLARFAGGGFGGGFGNLAGRAMAAQAASGAINAATAPTQPGAQQMPPAAAAVSDQQQRMNRISPIFAAKGC